MGNDQPAIHTQPAAGAANGNVPPLELFHQPVLIAARRELERESAELATQLDFPIATI